MRGALLSESVKSFTNPDRIGVKAVTSNAELSKIKPEDIIQPCHLAEYNRRMGIFSDDLTIAHTNLSILRQIRNFDAELFEAPSALLPLLNTNLIDQVLLILTRLWRDKTRGAMTMDKCAKWLREKGAKEEYRGIVACTIDQAMSPSDTCDVIESCRKIRHARVAHLSAQLPLRTTPVSVREVERAAESLGDFYNVMNFGATRKFVLVEFHYDGQKYYEGDFGYVLDQIALGSKWFSLPERDPHFRTLTERQLEKVNEVRRRYGMAPIL